MQETKSYLLIHIALYYWGEVARWAAGRLQTGVELDFGLLAFLYYFSPQRNNRKFCRLTRKGLTFLGESFKPKLLLLKYHLWNRRREGGFLLLLFLNNLLVYNGIIGVTEYWSNEILNVYILWWVWLQCLRRELHSIRRGKYICINCCFFSHNLLHPPSKSLGYQHCPDSPPPPGGLFID